MTTIACNRKQMAGDTLMTTDGMRGKVNKLHQSRGCILGYAGVVTEGMKWVKWYQKGCHEGEEPDIESGAFTGMVLTKEGIELWEDCSGPIKLLDDHYAIGEGAAVAIAALNDGKSPKDAVLSAAAVYTGTGTEVKVLRLKSNAPATDDKRNG
jgi:hypothetical protein